MLSHTPGQLTFYREISVDSHLNLQQVNKVVVEPARGLSPLRCVRLSPDQELVAVSLASDELQHDTCVIMCKFGAQDFHVALLGSQLESFISPLPACWAPDGSMLAVPSEVGNMTQLLYLTP